MSLSIRLLPARPIAALNFRLLIIGLFSKKLSLESTQAPEIDGKYPHCSPGENLVEPSARNVIEAKYLWS